MKEETLIPLAYDHDGSVVTVKTAVRGRQYICPDCGERLMYRNSGKTGPGHRRPHFAHIDGEKHRCTGESVLHATFKAKTAALLRSLIEEGKPFPIEWRCSACGTQHQGNLLYMAASVEEEHDLGACRPDIAVLDDKGNTIVALEVVVSHPPTDEVLNYYQEHSIILCRIDLNVEKTDEQLDDIAATITRAAQISFCRNVRCVNHNKNAVYRLLYLSKKCPVCNGGRRLFYTQVISPVCPIFNDGLTPAELDQAKRALPQGVPVVVNGPFYKYGWGIPCGCSSARPRRYQDTYYDPKVGRFIRRKRL